MADISGIMGALESMGALAPRRPQAQSGSVVEAQEFRDWLSAMRLPPNLPPDLMMQAYQMWNQMRLQDKQASMGMR
jgi:hypothetical protein